jgi:hypothetical protein
VGLEDFFGDLFIALMLPMIRRQGCCRLMQFRCFTGPESSPPDNAITLVGLDFELQHPGQAPALLDIHRR